MKKDAAIIGGGVVGQATAKALGIKYIFDRIKERSNINPRQLKNFKFLFLCLPTPSTSKGCSTVLVENAIKRFGNHHVYIIRSTVIPGTANLLMEKYDCQIVSNPEFLTGSTAEEDAKNPDIIVVGSDNQVLGKEIARRFYPKKKFPKSEIIITDNKTAETIKYSINTFYATKVIFANFLYRVCQETDVDYPLVKETMYKRKWIGKNHLTVPYRNQYGLTGKCLPKDLIAFAKYSKSPFFLAMVRFMETISQWQK